MRTRLASVASAILLASAAFAGTAGTALMATLTPITVTTPLETFPSGTSDVPSPAQNGGWLDITAQVNQGYNGYFVGVDTTSFPVSDTITMFAQFTEDNGATIQQGCGITTTGGVHHDRQGNVIFPSCGTQLPPTGPNGLKVRAVVTVPESGQLRLGARLYQGSFS